MNAGRDALIVNIAGGGALVFVMHDPNSFTSSPLCTGCGKPTDIGYVPPTLQAAQATQYLCSGCGNPPGGRC